MCKFRPAATGFTLIEVIVALGIIAFALSGAFVAVSSNVQNATGLKERSFAHWVAMNKIAEVHINNDAEWPPLRKSTGTEIMAENEWYWTMEVEKPEMMKEDTIRKITVSVKVNENDEYPISTIIAFVGKPLK